MIRVAVVRFFGRIVRQGLVSGGARVREAEARTSELDRELNAVTGLAAALLRFRAMLRLLRLSSCQV